MNAVLDASVIVAAVVSAHPHHAWARERLEEALTGQISGFVSVATMAEAFHLLTALPTRPRIRPRQARHLVDENLRDLSMIPVRARDWRAALSRATDRGLSGDAIWGALVAEGALGAGADALLTLDGPRAARLGEDVAELVRGPTDPSSG